MIATIIIKGSKIIENNNPKKISTNLLNFFSFPEKKIKIKQYKKINLEIKYLTYFGNNNKVKYLLL